MRVNKEDYPSKISIDFQGKMNELNMNIEVASLADLFLLDPLDENSTAAAIKVSEQEFVQMHPSVLRQKMAV